MKFQFAIVHNKQTVFHISLGWIWMVVLVAVLVLIHANAARAEEPLSPPNPDTALCEVFPTFTPERSETARRNIIRGVLEGLESGGIPTNGNAIQECVADYAANLWGTLGQFCAAAPVDPIGYLIQVNKVDDAFAYCVTETVTPKE